MSLSCLHASSGTSIQQLQERSQARVHISGEALGQSSEKCVTIRGTPDAISEALHQILVTLSANPLRPGTKSYEYKPGDSFQSHDPMSFSHQQQHQQPHHTTQFSHAAATLPAVYPIYQTTAPQPQHIYAHHHHQPVNAAPLHTQRLAIPSAASGAVIGRAGKTVKELRISTGCGISISDEDTLQHERIVTLTGSQQSIHAAHLAIRHVVATAAIAPPGGLSLVQIAPEQQLLQRR